MRATVAGSAALLTQLGLLITLLGPPSGPAARRRQQQGGAGTPVFDPVHPDKNPGARNNAGWVGLVKSEMPAEKMRAVAALMSEQHLPRGTYGDSCQGCVIEGAVLRCEPGCNNGQGETLKTSIDTTGCASASFENTRGALRCQGEPAGPPPPPPLGRFPDGSLMQHVMGSDGTYSQNYQDVWLMAVAKHNGWDRPGQKGFFLDLGAFNGVYCSNSKLLEEKLGWDGICVEPFPDNPNQPTQQSFESRGCVLVKAGLHGSIDGEVVKMHGGNGGAQSMKLNLEEDVNSPGGHTTTTVAIRSLFNCVNATSGGQTQRSCPPEIRTNLKKTIPVPNFINAISLDIEGLELSVLQNFPFEWVTVGAWVIEHNHEEPRRTEMKDLMASKGYVRQPVTHGGVDDYYVMQRFWDNSLANKAWREHPPGSHGC